MDLLSQPRYRVLNEPRGFIRCIEWLLAIIAFGCAADFSTKFELTHTCEGLSPRTYEIDISYPYKLDNFTMKKCDNTGEENIKPSGDFSPSAQWFVFVGVMSFLYCMCCIFYYVFLEAHQNNGEKVSKIDFGVTVVLSILWLTAASSLAWAKNELNLVTSQDFITKEHNLNAICSQSTSQCTISKSADFSKLNAAVAFGFLNLFVWMAGAWFVWKETSFFNRGTSSPYENQTNQTAPPAATA